MAEDRYTTERDTFGRLLADREVWRQAGTIPAAGELTARWLEGRSEYQPGHRLKKLYGGPFSEEIYRVFHEEFELPGLIEGYGMSEVPGLLNNPFPGPHRIGLPARPGSSRRFRFFSCLSTTRRWRR